MNSGAPAARASGDSNLKSDSSRRNFRTALILLSVALAFFLGVVAKYWLLQG